MNKTIINPEIRIQYSRLLDPSFQSLFNLRKEKGLIDKDVLYNTPEIIEEQVAQYQKAWEAREGVLSFMQEVLELNFYQSTINAYVVGSMRGGISAPIVIGSKHAPDYYADLLTHEIAHNLIGDNKQNIPIGSILLKLFPDETFVCRNHIVLHALMKKIFLEFLHIPESLERTKERDKKAPDYTRAWEIMEAMGEDAVIAQFKGLYNLS